MSHKSFVAIIIGLIVVAILAMLVVSQSRREVVKPEPVMDDQSGEMMTPEEVVEPTPSALPQGKINVQVACESALMYTTFTDGAAADAFVAECVEGKHPDVIDRYIESLGVDGATI